MLKIHFLGVVAFQSIQSKTNDGILFNGRPFHQRHCSVASGCFFLDMFMCHFSSVQRRSFRFMSPTTVDLPVVAHLQHGRKSGAGVLGACLDATEIEN